MFKTLDDVWFFLASQDRDFRTIGLKHVSETRFDENADFLNCTVIMDMTHSPQMKQESVKWRPFDSLKLKFRVQKSAVVFWELLHSRVMLYLKYLLFHGSTETEMTP